MRWRALSTSRCDLRRFFSVSCSKEEKRFGAGGREDSEAVVPEGEGREGGGLSGGSGAGVPNSGGDDDPSVGGGTSVAV